jgi:hypothetical protein
MMRQAIEPSGDHLGVGAEDKGPFADGEIGRDDDSGGLVETADRVEEEQTAGLPEGQTAEFVQDDEVHAGEGIGKAARRPSQTLLSTRLAGSTVTQNRPRAPARVQVRAMALAS